MTSILSIPVHDAEKGVGAATVDCPRRHQPLPLLVCEACAHSLHVSRTHDPSAWVVICDEPAETWGPLMTHPTRTCVASAACPWPPSCSVDGMKPISVYQYMTPHPHTVGRDQTLAFARTLMAKHRIRHLPVLDGGTLVGVVSDRDLRLVESIANVDPERVLVEDAMTGEPFFAQADTPIREVAEQMIEHKYGCAIVMRAGHAVGIFTTIDALRALLEIESKIEKVAAPSGRTVSKT